MKIGIALGGGGTRGFAHLAINILSPKETHKIGNLIEVAMRTFELSIGINKEILEHECDLLIEPAGLEKYNILDTSRAEELYSIGYDYCKKNDQIKFLFE